MPAYAVVNYRITNPESYEAYPPAVIPILKAHGAKILAADFDSEIVEGDAGHVTVVLEFPSKDAAHAFYDSPEYQEIAHHRTDNSVGMFTIVDGFVAPAQS